MDETKLVRLQAIYSALSNAKRLKILDLCTGKGHTITQLSKKLPLNYTITSEYVNMLARAGLVKRIQNPDRTVTVKSLVKISEDGELRKIKS